VWIALITVLYPISIWVFWGDIPAAYFSVPIVIVVALRLSRSATIQASLRLPAVVLSTLCIVLAFWLAPLVSALFYPFAISAAMLLYFLHSLQPGRIPVVERIARAHDASFTSAAVAYTRGVTWVWVVYFGVNAAINLVWIVSGNIDAWVFHNSVASYVVMGALFLGEWLVRQRVKQRHIEH